MKTALQELIEIIESSKQEADIQGVGICEVLDYHGIHDKATELLEKEREQKSQHAIEVLKDLKNDVQGLHGSEYALEKIDSHIEYYEIQNETYKQ